MSHIRSLKLSKTVFLGGEAVLTMELLDNNAASLSDSRLAPPQVQVASESHNWDARALSAGNPARAPGPGQPEPGPEGRWQARADKMEAPS